MEKIYPEKFKTGDEIRVVAPSLSLAILSKEIIEMANNRFAEMGFKLSFGKHVGEKDDFKSSSIQSRVEDIHEAFADKGVRAVFAVIGGSNCNQLLRYLDWDLIMNNPKIFCGYSDITALNNAILAKTGLVSYSGPSYSTFAQKLYFDYTLDYFKKCLFSNDIFEISPSENWSDDHWYKNQQERTLIKNNGFLIINEGKSSGTILGANLCTFNLLQGTEYFPKIEDSTILFLEDDDTSGKVGAEEFDRNLQSLIHLPDFKNVKGLVVGRFQKASEVSDDILIKIIKTKKELDNLPVVANVDFGHTSPIITFPIGGEANLEIKEGKMKLEIIKH
jgi:muramoyltetrapeptide carboxypeptidase LdcA involved in peptidoglycan recycling